MRCCRLLMHGGTQTVRFWGLQYVHWGCEGSCCCFLRLQSRLVWDAPKALQGRQGMCGSLAGWFQVAIQAVDWFVPEHHLCIGLRCRFCEVLSAFDHGGTQTVRFWGLQHVHWGCEGSCCCFLRLQSRLVWDVPKALQGRQGMCGSLAGWFQVAIQAVDWFVPEHHLCIGLRCRFCEVLSAFDAWWHANSPLLGATICPLGVWRLMLLLLAAAKQVGLRCSQGFARSTGDVRQPGRLQHEPSHPQWTCCSPQKRTVCVPPWSKADNTSQKRPSVPFFGLKIVLSWIFNPHATQGLQRCMKV